MTPCHLPLLLFGAFDRHHFGDLLFPYVAAALPSGRTLYPVGLLARDLRRAGGHRVQALARFAARWGAWPTRVLHVGGEPLPGAVGIAYTGVGGVGLGELAHDLRAEFAALCAEAGL